MANPLSEIMPGETGNPLDPYDRWNVRPLYLGPVGSSQVGGDAALSMPSPDVSPVVGWYGQHPVTAATRSNALDIASTLSQFGPADVAAIRAFHGSPYSFDRFDPAKIGTGEGAQAYGHGLYFAEREGVARSYRDQLATDPRDTLNNYLAGIRNFHDANDPAINEDAIRTGLERSDDLSMRQIASDPQSVKDIVSILRGYDVSSGTHTDEAMSAFRRLDKAMPPKATGSMYEVALHAEPEHFLDWDKPLSEQSQHVQDTLTDWNNQQPAGNRVPTKVYGKGGPKDLIEPSGQGIYKHVSGVSGNDVAAGAKALQEAGIPGIRYLDAGSRAAGEGSHNYVVFSPETIEILRRYGIAGLIGGTAAAGAATGGNGQEQ